MEKQQSRVVFSSSDLQKLERLGWARIGSIFEKSLAMTTEFVARSPLDLILHHLGVIWPHTTSAVSKTSRPILSREPQDCQTPMLKKILSPGALDSSEQVCQKPPECNSSRYQIFKAPVLISFFLTPNKAAIFGRHRYPLGQTIFGKPLVYQRSHSTLIFETRGNNRFSPQGVVGSNPDSTTAQNVPPRPRRYVLIDFNKKGGSYRVLCKTCRKIK